MCVCVCVYTIYAYVCICLYLSIYVCVHFSDFPPPSLRGVGVLRSTPPPHWPEGAGL